jgi:hemolysin activation/secretion protein
MRQFRITTLALLCFAACGGIAFSSLAYAQEDPNRVREALERRAQEQLRDQKRLLEQLPSELTKSSVRFRIEELPAETPCFLIREIKLSGEHADRFASDINEVQPLIGKCLGTKGLSYVASLLDQRFIERGYVTTRVALPAQNLREGVLNVQLSAGTIGEVRMSDAKGGSDWGIWQNAFPLSVGKLLNIRDLEQGVEQMKRLPSQQVATRIEPGEQPGTSTVVIERSQPPVNGRLRGGVTLDNSGSAALGRTNASVNASLDNPAGLNDIVNLSVNSNAERPTARQKSQSTSLFYSIPYGYNLFTVSSSASTFAQTVQGTTARFVSSGTSQNFEGRWAATVWRTSSTKSAVFVALSTRRARSYLDDVEILVQQRRLSNVEFGLQHKQLIGEITLDLELSHRRPGSFRGPQEDLSTAATGGLTLKPHLSFLNAELSAPIDVAGMKVRYDARFRLQTTSSNTLASDQFSIGSRGTVRGFDGDAVLQAEKGWFLRNEWSTAVPWGASLGVQSAAYLALDAGRVAGPSAQLLVGRQLTGTAAGIRGRWQSVSFDAAIATPIHQPSQFRSRKLNPYVTATWAF